MLDIENSVVSRKIISGIEGLGWIRLDIKFIKIVFYLFIIFHCTIFIKIINILNKRSVDYVNLLISVIIHDHWF